MASITGFQGFSVRYDAKGHLAKWSGVNKKGPNTNQFTLTELRMFTNYTIRVAARTTQNGNFSKAVYAKTLEGGKKKKIHLPQNYFQLKGASNQNKSLLRKHVLRVSIER